MRSYIYPLNRNLSTGNSNFCFWIVYQPKKLVFIPNGVDTEKFSPGKSKVKNKFKDDKLIIYFGRLHYQKNVDLLVKGFKLLKEKKIKES